VFHDSLANSRGTFAKVFAKAAHAAPECSTRMKRPPVFHVFTETPATMTDTKARLFVLVFDSAVPSPAKITAHATSTSNAGILREDVGRVCAKLRQRRRWNSS
jgi:hypothetical protein